MRLVSNVITFWHGLELIQKYEDRWISKFITGHASNEGTSSWPLHLQINKLRFSLFSTHKETQIGYMHTYIHTYKHVIQSAQSDILDT